GISLSFIAGEVKRAPKWVQRAGLEWLHRLAQEPRRLARRYLVQDIPFALFQLFPSALAARWKGGEGGWKSGGAPRAGDEGQAAGSEGRAAPGARNPAESVEGSTDYEGRHSRRRAGDSAEPPDEGYQ